MIPKSVETEVPHIIYSTNNSRVAKYKAVFLQAKSARQDKLPWKNAAEGKGKREGKREGKKEVKQDTCAPKASTSGSHVEHLFFLNLQAAIVYLGKLLTLKFLTYRCTHIHLYVCILMQYPATHISFSGLIQSSQIRSRN